MDPEANVLLVAEWTIDPHAVVAAASSRAARGAATFRLLVPAWLHGLDWAGDPRASRPCAAAQVERVRALALAAGLDLAGAGVGDPDPVAAIGDALDEWRVDEVLLCTRGRRLVAFRAARATGLPVEHMALPLVRSGHCSSDAT